MNTLIEFLVNNKRYFFFAAISAVAIVMSVISMPEFSGDLSGFDLENNERFEEFKRMNEIFDGDHKVFIHVVPSTNDRKLMHRSTDSLASIISKKYPAASILNPLGFYNKMIRYWKNKNNKLDSFLTEASNVPVLKQLISKDKKSFLLVATLDKTETIEPEFFNDLSVAEIEGVNLIESLSTAQINHSIEQYVISDFLRITLIVLGFFVLYILMAYRTVKALLFSGFIIILPITTSLALFAFFGEKINLISILVIPIVLILALSDALHLMSGYVRFNAVTDKNERLKKVIAHYIVPSFFSSATTAAAFFSFYWFNGSSYIQEFGIITAIALMIEVVLAFSIAPLLLYLLNPTRVYDRQISSVSDLLFKHRKTVTYISALILIISTLFIHKLSFKSDSEIFFPKNSQIKATHEEFKKNFYSSVNLNVLVTSKISKRIEDDTTFNYVRDLSHTLSEQNEVASVASATDNFFFKSKLGFPVNLFGNLGENNPYYNEELNTYRIEVHFPSANDINEFCIHKLPSLIKDPPPGVKVTYSSLSLLMDEVNSSVSRSLIQSLATSGLVIFLMILLMTRSITASLFSLVPNFIPLGCIVLIYYFFDIDINIITALSAVICLGLLDDDTVHILYRKLWLKEELNELTFSILSSAIILTTCFSFFTISSFKPVQTFGWVSALIFVIGVICELTLMQWIIGYILKRQSIK